MAATGFWPIRGKLSDALKYAENPNKTMNPSYLDKDLAAALEYAENSEKTDRRLFVTGINCSKYCAFDQMTAVKRRFCERGKNVAYHGYQSFQAGEVTPEEAHQIGIETARRMWGSRYQVIVTTHLNTDHLHNHFVVNSVSFRDGTKFRNKIGDHLELRRISDEVCRERGKTVLEHAKFRGVKEGAWWVRKNGGMTHREILKADVEECLKYSRRYDDLISRLRAMGYEIERNGEDFRHLSLKAPDWQRSIRLDSLGYPPEAVEGRFEQHWEDPYFYQLQNEHPRCRPKQLPLLQMEKELKYEIGHSRDTAAVLVDVIFYLILMLLQLTRSDTARAEGCRPLSPSVRMELVKMDQIQKESLLLAENHISTAEELVSFLKEKDEAVSALERERQSIRNRCRRPKSGEERAALNAQAREISAKLKPLREEQNTAKSIIDRLPQLQELLASEHALEIQARDKIRERSYER
jgi:hypothetical protein